MTATKVFLSGGGLKVNGFFFFGGQWYSIRKGAVPIVKLKPEIAAYLDQDYAAEKQSYIDSFVKPPTVPAKPSKPAGFILVQGVGLNSFCGERVALYREYLKRKGTVK